MTDLTDQWKKGELKAGYYYVKNEFGNIFPSDYSEEYDSINDCGVLGFWNEVSEITEVIAKVPTYEEYRNLQHCWVEELEENGQLKEQQETLEDAYNELVCINANLEDNCKTLAQTLLKVSPEHKAWLEKNYKEYL